MTVRGRTRAVVILLLACAITGCASVRANMGVRPGEPAMGASRTPEEQCTEYQQYATYAQQLQEAYHARASQNRWWIYVAAITGLGVAAATGGLVAASAVGAGTVALLTLSGGFTAGVFGTLDNPELAKVYTLAANSVDTSLQKADAHLTGEAQARAAEARVARLQKELTKKKADAASAQGSPSAVAKDKAVEAVQKSLDDAKQNLEARQKVAKDMTKVLLCREATLVLRAEISKARKRLELARTNSAAGALARAQDERKALDEIIKQLSPAPSEGSTDSEDAEPQ